MDLEINKDYLLIIGMGATGYSVAKFLNANDLPFLVCDTRKDERLGEKFRQDFPKIPLIFGDVKKEIIERAREVVVSPGISLRDPLVQCIKELEKKITSDIELFLNSVDRPVIGITGSNGKSTLTTMVGLALKEAGMNVGVGGNIGTPALTLLDSNPDVYVLELSSFQLELLERPNLEIACILNVSQDHMDRYDSFEDYRKAKQTIYRGANKIVFFADDSSTYPGENVSLDWMPFGIAKRKEKPFYKYHFDNYDGFIKYEDRSIIHKEEVLLKGIHNTINALALFSIARQFSVSEHVCCEVLRDFSGLPHRCQFVAKYPDGITYINDSKATNVGATIAAIKGLIDDFSKIVLIAGGDGKGADFTELGETIVSCVSNLILLGADANKINCYVDDRVEVTFADSMPSAVAKAKAKANFGDLVLLSPACSSLDMFLNFEDRGNQFTSSIAESYS